jgi:enterobactin synthetase component D
MNLETLHTCLQPMPPVDISKLIPDCATFHSMYVPTHECDLDHFDLPPQLLQAVKSRKLEFSAGRSCVRQALHLLGAACADDSIGVGHDRSPQWPAGYVGSISHANGIALAVVAPADRVYSVGVDLEAVLPMSTFVRVLSSIASPSEFAEIKHVSGLDVTMAATFIFSAKEAVFKCLYPVVQRFIGFNEVEIVSINMNAGTYTAHLLISRDEAESIPDLINGRFQILGDLICTVMTLDSRNHPGPTGDMLVTV